MVLKHEWFEKMIRGEKTIEYREVKQYWDVRLNKPLRTIIFREGYRKNARQIEADILKIEIVPGSNTDLHCNRMVYAIHLKNIRRYVCVKKQ